MKMYNKGLVIGKFYPPHLGHKFLIDKAMESSNEVYVLVCDDERQIIKAEQRRDWLQVIHPEAIVKVIPEIYDDENSERWAEHTKNFLGFVPDAVFTSEDYGHAYAKFLGCPHVQVDKERVNVPISATKVRNNLLDNLNFLHMIVKKDLIKRVVVLGAESTGTTTLAKELAKYYGTAWVPEFGRIYSESLPNIFEYEWKKSDFAYIAKTQRDLENHLAAVANKVLICDTDAFTTQLWEERYLGVTSEETEKYEGKVEDKLYILTGDEIPFVQDGIRDGEDIRHRMHKRFIEILNERKLNWILVQGNVEERLQKATMNIDRFMRDNIFQTN